MNMTLSAKLKRIQENSSITGLKQQIKANKKVLNDPDSSSKQTSTAERVIEACKKRLLVLSDASVFEKPEEIVESPKGLIMSTKQPEDRRLIVAAKYLQLLQSATKRNKEFNLTIADVNKLMSRKTCGLTGVKFNEHNKRTIDRIDANKGYVKGNVMAVTHKANQIKNILLESENSEYKTELKQLQRMFTRLGTLLE